VGQFGLVDAGGLGQRAGHQLLADAHAKAAGEQLVEDEALGGSELSQASRIAALRVLVRLAASARRRAIQWLSGRSVSRRGFGQDQRDGLGQVADDGIAGLEEPERDARALRRPFAQLASW
jgi:hypothetical protein